LQKKLEGHSPFADLLRREIVVLDADERRVEVTFEVGPEFKNRSGTVAGGALSAMLDSVTGLSGMTVAPEGCVAVHTTLRVEYLHPGQPGQLFGRGRVTGLDDRDVTAEGELLDPDGTVVARGVATLRIVRRRER